MGTEMTPSNSQPDLEVSENLLDFGILRQGVSATLQVVITNPNKSLLFWNLRTGFAGWVILSAIGGTLQPGGQQVIDVTVDTSSLPLGNYSGALTIHWEPAGAPGYAQQIVARLVVEEQSSEVETAESASTLRIRITEEPLTAQNLTTFFPAMTELYTKCWLIQQGRYVEVMEYMQTHDVRFVEAANLVITRLEQSSPVLIEFLSNPANMTGIAALIGAITAAINTLVQTHIKSAAAKLEREKQQLDIDLQRSETRKKQVEEALHTANILLDNLNPHADGTERAIAIQTVLPNLLQLQDVKGLEPVLPMLIKSSGLV